MQHVFSSYSFDAWEQMLLNTLGEHRSNLSAHRAIRCASSQEPEAPTSGQVYSN